MTQPAKVQEPSMEEILASIRRIIADDEAKPADLAVAAGAGVGTAADVPPRLHNVAAVGPQPVPASTGASRSREEIDSMLAGIEKIITEPAHGEADVFELTDEMAVPNVAPTFRKVEAKDDVEFADPPQPLSPRETPPQQASKSPGPNAADILSHSTAASVESAFNSLAATVLSNNSRTLEDIVREMMRPMLKSWLDDNLPSLVERIVKTEIERVARGR